MDIEEEFRPHLECACGLKIEVVTEDILSEIYSEHDCPNAPPRPIVQSAPETPDPWYSYVFSFPTVLMLIVIELTIVYLVHPDFRVYK